MLARTFYPELTRAGVKIYEYTPGFVHAKVFVSDDEKAVVGTINLDFRSLYLHFECAAYIYRNPVVFDVERDFEETLKKCSLITMEDCKNYSWMGKKLGRLMRLPLCVRFPGSHYCSDLGSACDCRSQYIVCKL